MAGGREFQLIWLKGKYIRLTDQKKGHLWGGCMAIAQLSILYNIHKSVDFYFECGVIKIKCW